MKKRKETHVEYQAWDSGVIVKILSTDACQVNARQPGSSATIIQGNFRFTG